MLALKCIANMFKNNSSLYMLQSKRQFIVEHVAPFLLSPNKSIRNAAITIILK